MIALEIAFDKGDAVIVTFVTPGVDVKERRIFEFLKELGRFHNIFFNMKNVERVEESFFDLVKEMSSSRVSIIAIKKERIFKRICEGVPKGVFVKMNRVSCG